MHVEVEFAFELHDNTLVRCLGKAESLSGPGVLIGLVEHGHGGLAQLNELLVDAVPLLGCSHGLGHHVHWSRYRVGDGGGLH